MRKEGGRTSAHKSRQRQRWVALLYFSRSLWYETTADTKQQNQEDRKQSCCPCPRGGCPGIRVIHKDFDQRIEEVFLQIVKQTARVFQKATVRNERVGARFGSVAAIEALALWADGAIYRIGVVANTPTRTIERTKQIRAGLT